MGMVTLALFFVFLSMQSKDERESAFSPNAFPDKTFARTTGLSFLRPLPSTVLDIFIS
jgi:hypothetical protein